MISHALVAAAATIVIAPVAYLLGRNQRHLMADIDRYPTPYRTCPEPDDYTRCKAMLEREGLA